LPHLELGENELARVLKAKPHIKTINLSNNSVNGTAIKALSKVLSLQELNVAENNITAAGTESLSMMVKPPNSQLHILDLSGNLIGNDGVYHFASSDSLHVLRVFTCHVSSEGGQKYLKI
jgi:Ran GTPase-activating protein (RanGAP) involved in mRNA processing and transport